MASTINSNIQSLTAQRNLSSSQTSLSTSMQRLSSGLRINSAKDDAAGLSISNRMTSQIRGLTQAARNANDGISLSQTAEGALDSASSMLQRIRELAVQSANDTNTADDRKSLQAETGQLLSELDRIATSTQFNGRNLLDGSLGSSTFQVGANAHQTITSTTSSFRTSVYGAQLAQSKLVEAGAALTVLGGAVQINGAKTETVTLVDTDTAATAADKINSYAGSTGVTASARTMAEFNVMATGNYSLAVKGDDTTTASNIKFNVTAVNTSDGLKEAVSAFNKVSSQTGITAKLNSASDGIVLTNDAGANIDITNSSDTGGNDVTLAAYDAQSTVASTNTTGDDQFGAAATAAASGGVVLSQGSIEFDSDSGFSFGTSASALVTASGTSTLNAVSSIDISTVTGSTRALKVVDSALAAVDGQRAQFGALQSRFESAMSNLASSNENLSAARSRIQDADFASETANLSRAQILQQAGTAMVAQANQLPQGVLALMR
jgi:flagellin